MYYLCISALLLSLCSLLGCATPDEKGHRFYSGPPLPDIQVALVYAISCDINDIREKDEKDVKRLGYRPSRELELLPGQYVAGVAFSRSTSTSFMGTTYTSSTEGGEVQLDLHVQKVFPR
jgi:hypothetical protein